MRFPKRSFARPSAIAATAIALAALASAHADQTWTGATDSDFNTGSNYLGGSYNEWTNYVFDSSAVNGTMNVDDYTGWGNISLNSGLATDIVINAANPSAHPVIMAPGLYAGGTIEIASDSKNLTINTDYLAVNGLLWNVGAGRSLTINGKLSNWNGATASLSKAGAGTAILTGSNNYTGGTSITGGTLQAYRGSLGTGSVVVNNGGTLYLNDQWVLCGANPYGVTERNIGTLTINAGGTLELDAVQGFVNGATNLILNGGLITGGPNDFRGDLFLWNGNQQITAGGEATSTIASIIGVTGNNNTITVDAESTLNLTGGIKNSDWYSNGSSPGGIIKAGPGTLSISGSNTYTGTTTINAGTLILGNGTHNTGLSDSAAVSISSDAILQLNYLPANIDTIDQLFLGGVQAASGTWGSLASSATHKSALITGSGLLNVSSHPRPTYHVSTSGSDAASGSAATPFATLAKAASLVRAGDLVLVAGGTYIEKSITPAVSGNEGSYIFFKPAPGTGDVIIKHPATSSTGEPVFQLGNRNYIWIEGFTFKDSVYLGTCIRMSGSQNNVVVNNRFENLGNSGVESANSIISIENSAQNVVSNNYFQDVFGDAVGVNSSQFNLVSHNTFIRLKGKLRSWGGPYLFSCAVGVAAQIFFCKSGW